MIKVYYAKVSPFLEEGTFLSHIYQMEEKRREQLNRIKSAEGKKLSFYAGSLLHDVLCMELGLLPETTNAFKILYEESGKPYLKDYPQLYFNLSHSGEYVCCALSDTPVGVDVQKMTDVREGIAERFFTHQENLMLNASCGSKKDELFFRMWSIKESYMKLTGKGMGQGLDSFEIDWETHRIIDTDVTAYFTEQSNLSGYALCVCSWEETDRVEWKRIFFAY